METVRWGVVALLLFVAPFAGQWIVAPAQLLGVEAKNAYPLD